MTDLFRRLPPRRQAAIADAPYDRWLTPGGDVVALFYRRLDGYLLRFPDRADFHLAHGDLRVACIPAPGASSPLIFDLFHNQVAPLIRNHQGDLVLHASAVAAPAGVLGFVGGSGFGKSTLAASLALAGNPFLTDDGLALQAVPVGYVAAPQRAYLRLWPDSDCALFERPAMEDSAEKTLVDAGPALPFRDRAEQLLHLYLLTAEPGQTLAIEPLIPARALSELMRHSFILDVEDRPRLHAHFERLAALAEAIPCFSLDFPRRYEELPRVVGALLDHAAHGAAAA